jgi:hypothetical protein
MRVRRRLGLTVGVAGLLVAGDEVPAWARGGGTGLNVSPNHGAPGARQMGILVGDLLFYALLGCVAGVIVGGATWALASHAGNYQHAASGKLGFLAGLGGAVVAGAAVAIVNYGFGLGRQF